MKAGIAAAFAVIFGIVQVLCACMYVPAAQASVPAKIVPHMSMDMTGHDHHTVMDTAKDSAFANHGEHDHKADCSHCDDTVVVVVSDNISPSGFTASAAHKSAYLDAVPYTRADMAGAKLSRLHWLDPPRQAVRPTPVALHTRSQI